MIFFSKIKFLFMIFHFNHLRFEFGIYFILFLKKLYNDMIYKSIWKYIQLLLLLFWVIYIKGFTHHTMKNSKLFSPPV